MTGFPYHQSLRLRNFTAFSDAQFEFVSGINVFVGANGTGKTHAMKALYAMQMPRPRGFDGYALVLRDLFQINDTAHLIRREEPLSDEAQASGAYDSQQWQFTVSASLPGGITHGNHIGREKWPVFIPAIDMMGHTQCVLS